jgi:hypothetical protein
MKTQRLTLRESVVLRCLGLLIFIAPQRGADWLVDIHVRTNERVAATRREETETSLAA